MKYILCLGDSLTFGARDEYHRSYPAELSRMYFERDGISVYCQNSGVSGETSGQVLKRTYKEVRGNPKMELGLLIVGSNDTFISTPLDVYEDNLRQIVGVMKDYGMKVGIGLLPPIVGPGLINYPKDANEQVKRFNDVIASEADKKGLILADFSNMGKYIIDTVHFGHKGYIEMANIWYNALNLKGIVV